MARVSKISGFTCVLPAAGGGRVFKLQQTLLDAYPAWGRETTEFATNSNNTVTRHDERNSIRRHALADRPGCLRRACLLGQRRIGSRAPVWDGPAGFENAASEGSQVFRVDYNITEVVNHSIRIVLQPGDKVWIRADVRSNQGMIPQIVDSFFAYGMAEGQLAYRLATPCDAKPTE